MCKSRRPSPEGYCNTAFQDAYARRPSPHFSNKVAHRASESGKSCFAITTCADLEGWPDADGV